jgi:quinoprotein glucose dehydrogenase
MKCLIASLALLLTVAAVRAEETAQDAEKEPVPTAEQTLGRLQLAEGLRAELVAAEPLLRNPICFWMDPQGKIYVCESDRQNRGVPDNRQYTYWVDDDLAARTVEDREAFYKKHLGKSLEEFTKYDDRIRLLVDTDGDRRMDRATVFAEGFNGLLQGSGAGVLAHNDEVFYTCIPDLWKLHDRDGDGKAETRESLHTGYGVHVAYRGHDMHGLVMGPDGRLYFSIGDRGYNVLTAEGHLENPDSGAVFRCWPDGSGLEEVVTGLRNPQELVFDQLGNLFTCDNSSDYGDISRWIYLAPGGDAGWRFAFQYKPRTSPWLTEQLWLPYSASGPASQLPVIANIADGPAGLTAYPGTGMGEQFRDKFFLSDFRGEGARSGVRSFRMRPRGAFFEAYDLEKPVWGALTTDVDFGPDGALYVCDWVESWDGVGAGRIYRIFDPTKKDDPAVLETATLLKTGFSDSPPEKLATLLAHADRRVRQGAQFELAARGELEPLLEVLQSEAELLPRLHALWGLGQIARRQPEDERLRNDLVQALSDREQEIRGRAAELAGELQLPARIKLEQALADASPRVRYFAALALRRLGTKASIEWLVRMLEENNDSDPLLRHAGVMALAGIAAEDAEPLHTLVDHSSPAVRTAVLLALRRLADPRVARFLSDLQPQLATEAARAIYDVPIVAALPELAGQLKTPNQSEPLLRRALVANYRLGTAAHAAAVARFAADPAASEPLRTEALELLASWTKPESRDPLLGLWRPLAARDQAIATEALRDHLAGLLAAPAAVRTRALQLAASLHIDEAAEGLLATFRDPAAEAGRRSQALRALAALDYTDIASLIDAALTDRAAAVRIAARELLADRDPRAALLAAEEALRGGEISEQQAAFDLLASLPESSQRTALLLDGVDRLLAGSLPAEVELEVLEAARTQSATAVQDRLAHYQSARSADGPLAAYHETLHGGDAERGKTLFYYRTELACVRCHRIAERGDLVGPELSKVGAEKTRKYLLESLLQPSAQIDERYASHEIETIDGKIVTGLKVSEGDAGVELLQADGRRIRVPEEKMESIRVIRQSAMPEGVAEKISRRQLRDLIAFLASLRGADSPEPPKP